jgi:hypothetical protein
LGGFHAAGLNGTGTHIYENIITSSVLRLPNAATDDVIVQFRGAANKILSFTATDAGAHHLMHQPDYGLFTWRYEETDGQWAYYITDASFTTTNGRVEGLRPHQFALPFGVWLGGDGQNIAGGSIGSHNGMRYFGRVNAASYPATSLRPDIYGAGDTVISTASPGGHWGWTCTTTGGIAGAWAAGQDYPYWPTPQDSTIVKNSAGRFYRLVGDDAGTSSDEPVHTSGTATTADGYQWKHLTDTSAVIKRFGPLMGDATTVVDDPIFSTSQTWNDAAVTFRGHKTNITSTASAAASMLEDWQVSSSTQANIRKDGRIAATASTAPVAGGAQTIQMTSTAGLGVYAGADAPTVSAAKGSLYLRTNGSTTNDRMYVNTDGGTTWTAVTTAA